MKNPITLYLKEVCTANVVTDTQTDKLSTIIILAAHALRDNLLMIPNTESYTWQFLTFSIYYSLKKYRAEVFTDHHLYMERRTIKMDQVDVLQLGHFYNYVLKS